VVAACTQRSLHCARVVGAPSSLSLDSAMAAVDVSAVIALSRKAMELGAKERSVHAAQKLAEALAAAQALQQPADCLIVATFRCAVEPATTAP
jgi:hypothetical protein